MTIQNVNTDVPADALPSARPFAGLHLMPVPADEPFVLPATEEAMLDWQERRRLSDVRFMNRQQNDMAFAEAELALDTHVRRCRRLRVW